MSSAISTHIAESSRVIASLESQTSSIEKLAEQLCSVIQAGGEIFTCGNGGSACDAMHFVEELVARYKRERPGIKARHLMDAGTITCWANDYEFESVFERQVETFCSEKDLLVVFSTSGNSENILRALATAKKKNTFSIALLGNRGGKAATIADASLIVDSDHTEHIQEAHITIVHMLCEFIETTLF